MFCLAFTDEAKAQLTQLKRDKSHAAQYKAVIKALHYLQTNPRHPSLNSKRYHSIPGHPKVFESSAQQHIPGAFRIFWEYHPDERKVIIILMIVKHPD